MEYSMWGPVQDSISLVRGMRLVSTPGHGGIIVSKKFAEKNLSEAALKRGVVYGSYYSYEEDCDYAIPLFEIKASWDKFFSKEKSGSDIKEDLIKVLSRWHADYLLEIGVEPDEEQYSYFKHDRLETKMRREKHPDLVVAVFGDYKTKTPGLLEVHTADGKVYHARSTKKYEDDLIKRLSNLSDVKEK